MIKVGQKVKCKPYIGIRTFGLGDSEEVVDGVVTNVNEAHRWFTVEYGEGHRFKVSFNFNDIGDIVWKI